MDSGKFSSNMTTFIESWWTPDGVHQIHQDYLEYVEQGKVYLQKTGPMVAVALIQKIFSCQLQGLSKNGKTKKDQSELVATGLLPMYESRSCLHSQNRCVSHQQTTLTTTNNSTPTINICPLPPNSSTTPSTIPVHNTWPTNNPHQICTTTPGHTNTTRMMQCHVTNQTSDSKVKMMQQADV